MTTTTSFLPYNKTDFFFYSGGCNTDTNMCNTQSCSDINYTDNIFSTDNNIQLCLNNNLYTQLNKIQENNGGAEQRYTDLIQKKDEDNYSIGYSILGICIMFGIIKFA